MSNTDFNCAGFAFGTNQWEDLWDKTLFDKAWAIAKESYDCFEESAAFHAEELKYITVLLADKVCQRFGVKLAFTTPTEAKVDTVAMRIKHNSLFSDYHFAIKKEIDGETCWLHKQGSKSIDMMFDTDIISDEWEGGYNSPVVYFIKEE